MTKRADMNINQLPLGVAGTVLGYNGTTPAYIGAFQGATAFADGVFGTVPAPLTGQQDYFLKADGTWAPGSGGGGGDMILGSPQVVTALKTFNASTFALTNPANTFSYSFVTSAIAAGRTVTLPLLTANDTFVMQAFAQTLTNKTISGAANTITNVSLTTGVTGVLPVANGGTGVTTSTGTGNTVLSTSPTLVTPVLGTPTSVTLTNATGLPLSTGVTGNLPVSNLNSGTSASATTFWAGDGAWKAPFTLTTTGTSGAATFISGVLNIPSYTGGGGGGITNGAAANELMKSDGTNAVASGIFSTSAGSILLGSTSDATLSRSITAQGSGANININLNAKGSGNANFLGTQYTFLDPSSNAIEFRDVGGYKTINLANIGALSGLKVTTASKTTSTSSLPIEVRSGDMSAGGTTGNTGSVTIQSGDFTQAGGTGNTGGVNILTGTNFGSGTRGAISMNSKGVSINPTTGWIAVNNATSTVTVAADTAAMYVNDITAGNAAFHFKTELGQIIKLYQTNAGSNYSLSNVTTRRTIDANSTTLDEVVDLICTLINDVKLPEASSLNSIKRSPVACLTWTGH